MAIAALIAAWPAAAARADALKPLAGAASPVFTDGSSLAAYARSLGDVTVLDSAGHKRSVPAPERTCAPAGKARLVAAGRRQLLFDTCSASGLVLTLASGLTTPVPEWSHADYSPDQLYLSGVGANWVRYSSAGYHWHRFDYVNWHTGRWRLQQDNSGYYWPAFFPNLDRRRLFTGVCEPLASARPPAEDTYDLGPPADPLGAYAGRWGAVVVQARVHTWVIQRCGRKRPLLRLRCNWCSAPTIGGGLATWMRSGRRPRVYALRLRDGHRFSWPSPSASADVTHISGRVFVHPQMDGSPGRDYSARVPG